VGILSRFREIMSSNVHAVLERSDDPVKELDAFMRSLNADLGKVKAETASVLAAESRAKRALDECREEIRKLQRYAEKSVEAGRDGDALKFLEKKAEEARKESSLQSAYDTAAANAACLLQMQEKLAGDIAGLEARRSQLKGKLAAAEAQRKLNDAGPSYAGAGDSLLEAMEEKADRAYHEAMALADLRAGGAKDEIDALFEQYEKRADAGPEDELAELKKKLGKRD
jgi:Phage shock protein A (IM30), suppresses sigma54-dependent transcription